MRRTIARATVLALLAGMIVGAAPAAAWADDNCEPTELVIRATVDPNYEEPGDEGDKPLCQGTAPVYEALGCVDLSLPGCIFFVLRRETGLQVHSNPGDCLRPPVLISLQECIYGP